MSNITIYHPTLDLDPELRLKTEEIFNIMQRGQAAAVEMCIAMAEHQKLINSSSRKKNRGELQTVICELMGIEKATYFRHARAGKEYLANPNKRNLSPSAILAKPKQLSAPKPKPAKTVREDVTDMQAELEKLRNRVKVLESEVEYLKEERDDLRGWLDDNTRARAEGVYSKLNRQMLH